MTFRILTSVFLFLGLFVDPGVAQVAWYRSIGGDSLSIEASSAYPLENGDYLMTGIYRGVFDLNEGSSFSPMMIESLVNQDNVHQAPCFFVARFSSEGECLTYWRIDPEDGETDLEIDRLQIAGVSENGDVMIVIRGSNGFQEYMDLDPGPGQVLMNINDYNACIALYSETGSLLHSGILDDHDYTADVKLSSTGFLVHWSHVNYGGAPDIGFSPESQELGLAWSNGSVDVLAKYDWSFGLEWFKVIGLEENSEVSSDEVFELADGRVVWLIRNVDQFDVDLDPGPGVNMMEHAGIIIYDPNGNYLDSKSYANSIFIKRMKLIDVNDIRCFGSFSGNPDFDFGSGTTQIPSFGSGNNDDIFIASYDSSFNLNWVKSTIGDGLMNSIRGGIAEASNIIGFRHGIGNYDIDATSPGFYLVESLDSDAYTIFKTDIEGRPIAHFEASVYLTEVSVSNSNESGLILRNKYGSDDDLIVNGVTYPLVLGNGPIHGLQMVGCDFQSTALVHGQVFLDENNNGVWDVGEHEMVGQKLRCIETSGVVSSDSSGEYIYPIIPGNYTFEPIVPLYYTVSTSQSIPMAVQLANDTVVNLPDIGIHIIPGIIDLVTDLSLVNPLRPGFASQVVVHSSNIGTENVQGTVSVLLPEMGTVTAVQPLPAIQTADSMVWDIGTLEPFGTFHASFTFVTDTNVLLIGDTAVFEAMARPNSPDETPSDNHRIIEDVIVGSYDPNDKTVSPSVAQTTEPVAVGEDHLTYLIRFQNTGTFPTSFVHLKDTLSENLDISTFRMIASSHPCQYQINEDRVVTWGFEPLVLPDSASDPDGSSGYVLFSIELAEGNTLFEDVENKAYIYFDLNPPIITEPAIFHFEIPNGIGSVGMPLLGIYPNPASAIVRFAYAAPKGVRPILQLTDMMGRSVEAEQLPSNEGIYTVDVAGLSEGIYSCVLMNGSEILGSGKLSVVKE